MFECTGEGMVMAREKWLKELGVLIENSMLCEKVKLWNWVSRQVFGHEEDVRFESAVEERMFWRGLLKQVHTAGAGPEVGKVVQVIVDGYISMWKVRCRVMGKAKEEARSVELRERRAVLVAEGLEERRVRRWSLKRPRKESVEVLGDSVVGESE